MPRPSRSANAAAPAQPPPCLATLLSSCRREAGLRRTQRPSLRGPPEAKMPIPSGALRGARPRGLPRRPSAREPWSGGTRTFGAAPSSARVGYRGAQRSATPRHDFSDHPNPRATRSHGSVAVSPRSCDGSGRAGTSQPPGGASLPPPHLSAWDPRAPGQGANGLDKR